MPNSGYHAWRSHMAEKSPRVQPTRHRNVFTAARCQVGPEDQNWGSVGRNGRDCEMSHEYRQPPRAEEFVNTDMRRLRGRISLDGAKTRIVT
ncbi:hypothetical protein AAE478_010372 [Parahypoxylon ruwenzoriense]